MRPKPTLGCVRATKEEEEDFYVFISLFSLFLLSHYLSLYLILSSLSLHRKVFLREQNSFLLFALTIHSETQIFSFPVFYPQFSRYLSVYT